MERDEEDDDDRTVGAEERVDEDVPREGEVYPELRELDPELADGRETDPLLRELELDTPEDERDPLEP